MHISDIPGLDGLGMEHAVFRDPMLSQVPGAHWKREYTAIPESQTLPSFLKWKRQSVGFGLHVYFEEENIFLNLKKSSNEISYSISWKEKVFG